MTASGAPPERGRRSPSAELNLLPALAPIRWFVLAGDQYREVGARPLLAVKTADLVAGIDWPS